MKVLFVVNSFYAKGNGLSASARRTVDELEKLGAQIRVLSLRNPDPDGPQPFYALPPTRIPVFQNLVERQCYAFAHSDKKIIKQALSWADVVHIEEPFWLQVVTCRLAKRMGVPCVGTYHLHPENLFSSIHLRKSLYFNSSTMLFWKKTVFDHCRILQCPTENVRQRLEKWHFKSELRVISNGMIVKDKPQLLKKPHSVFTIVSIGRYSIEKDQSTLLRAMKYCRHAQEIQLVLAGRGPREAKLKKQAQKLYDKNIIKYPVQFCYLSAEGLEELYSRCDLYVHCATVEVEGLSCTEAIGTGLVPVIAESKLSATSQYAHLPQNSFKAGDAKTLAERLDWWFEHRDNLDEESRWYTSLDLQYDIRDSARQVLQMYQDTLEEK